MQLGRVHGIVDITYVVYKGNLQPYGLEKRGHLNLKFLFVVLIDPIMNSLERECVGQW